MGTTKKRFLLACLLALSAAAWAGAETVLTQLSADVMDYDTETQEFFAKGNVRLQRLQMTITADNGAANNLTRTARMWSNVKGFGAHDGQKVDFVCQDLTVDLSGDEPRYTMTGQVDATLGDRTIVAESAWMQGGDFAAQELTRFYDAQQKTTLAACSAEGSSDGQGIADFRAQGDVYLKQVQENGSVMELWSDSGTYSRRQGTTTATGKVHIKQVAADGQITEIWGDRMVRSERNDSITATGNARATQEGRRITAEELIYYPTNGKLDARGRPQITVDLSNGNIGGN